MNFEEVMKLRREMFSAQATSEKAAEVFEEATSVFTEAESKYVAGLVINPSIPRKLEGDTIIFTVEGRAVLVNKDTLELM